ncbi:MAG: LysR family transcriptional regulator [Arthrobacter sp.]|nr:LysR family transcriptional regulator [Arthrobacter sp.]
MCLLSCPCMDEDAQEFEVFQQPIVSHSRLKSKRLAESRRVVCATPHYRNSIGRPRTVAELEQHSSIILRQDSSDSALWRCGSEGREQHMRVNGNVVSDDGEVVTGWCLQALELIMRSSWRVNPMLHRGCCGRSWKTCRRRQLTFTPVIRLRVWFRTGRRFSSRASCPQLPNPWRSPRPVPCPAFRCGRHDRRPTHGPHRCGARGP